MSKLSRRAFISELFRSVEAYRPIIVGTIIILMLIFAPNGIIHEMERIFVKLKALRKKKGIVFGESNE